ncbi:hypothetical protein ACGFYU_06280 [Streptomyces sp. NPDC048337]|uniref:hypothetical protein n=1 Tax=Streptomyces sp. NPDC048337 TaxID=3365535 RepID=UPI00371B6868
MKTAEATPTRPSGYGHDRDYRLTAAGRDALSRFGIDVAGLPGRRPLVRYCVDWSEQQHHLAGGVGAAITARLFQLEWLRYGVSPRVVHLTDAGAAGFAAWLGLRLED